MSSELPISVEQMKENSSIADRMKHAVATHAQITGLRNTRSGRFINPSDPRAEHIFISDIKEEVDRKEERACFAPDWFRTPFYILELYSGSDDKRVTSPYGAVPTTFNDRSGIPFDIRNLFYFNEFGQGIKYEDIAMLYSEEKSDEENLTEFGDYRDFPEVDITAAEQDARHVSLELGDFELVGMVLYMIETGVHVPSEL